MLVEKKFKIRKAMLALSQSNNEKELLWNLACLLAWAFLDQQTGNQSNSTRQAKRVGRIILSRWLHARWSEIKIGKVDDDLRMLMQNFDSFGGMEGIINTPTPASLLRRFKQNEGKFRFIREITSYLCRVDNDSSVGRDQLTISFAKLFVREVQSTFNSQRTYGDSQISKIWEQYARSAPFIYAAYQVMPELQTPGGVKQTIYFLTELVNKPREVKRLVGYASYAAAVFAKTDAHKVLIEQFQTVEPEKPNLLKFSDEDKAILTQIKNDQTAPIP